MRLGSGRGGFRWVCATGADGWFVERDAVLVRLVGRVEVVWWAEWELDGSLLMFRFFLGLVVSLKRGNQGRKGRACFSRCTLNRKSSSSATDTSHI